MRFVHRAATALLIAAPSAARAEAEFRVAATGDGFDDTTPVQPIRGNPGTTLGEQRRLALEHATEIWGAQLDSNVSIQVHASFPGLGCEPRGAVLAQAVARRLLCDDAHGTAGTPQCHVSALADRLADRDLVPGEPDIEIEFNASIDGTCGAKLGGSWYYGFESGSGAQNDFVEVALHELAHGLGFSAFVDLETGELELMQIDSFSAHIRDLDLDRTWAELTDTQRAASAIHPGRVVWEGPATQRAASLLLVSDPRATRQGRSPYRGADALARPLLYAPASLELGSSISHFDRSATPDLLMEPSYSGFPQHQLDLTLPVLRDMGWSSSCGNGRLDRSEECDDGAANDDTTADHCRTTCKRPYCGDGVLDLAEACDEGPDNSDTRPNGCRSDCRRSRCGDGVVDGDEACDGSSGCTPKCTLAKAGNVFRPWTVAPSGAERPRASDGCGAARYAARAPPSKGASALALLCVLALLASARKK